MFQQDHYSVLGVPPTASFEQLRQAYRRLAVQHHPDANPGDPQAEERFKRVEWAFASLSDPRKRAAFDEERRPVRWTLDPGSRAGLRVPPLRRGRRVLPSVGPAIELSLVLTLRELVFGTRFAIHLVRRPVCAACEGAGTVGARRRHCPSCGGRGRVRVAKGRQGLVACTDCEGLGKVAPICAACKGQGCLLQTSRVELRFPAGALEGSRWTFAGQGEPGHAGGAAGPLVVALRQQPHPLIRRSGHDLELTLPLTVGEAVRGTTLELPTFEGVVSLTVPPGVQSGTRLRLKGKGVPHAGGRGDLYAVVQVRLPEGASAGLRRASELIDDLYLSDVRAGLEL